MATNAAVKAVLLLSGGMDQRHHRRGGPRARPAPGVPEPALRPAPRPRAEGGPLAGPQPGCGTAHRAAAAAGPHRQRFPGGRRSHPQERGQGAASPRPTSASATACSWPRPPAWPKAWAPARSGAAGASRTRPAIPTARPASSGPLSGPCARAPGPGGRAGLQDRGPAGAPKQGGQRAPGPAPGRGLPPYLDLLPTPAPGPLRPLRRLPFAGPGL